jgi:phosphate transport system substrate-binding protein
MKLVTTALAITLAGFSYAAQAQEITGAGSTFAAPIYGKWAEAAQGVLGVKLNYQAIGSGAGINQINNRTVDFGASDMPVAGDQLAEHKLVQFPTVIGGVVMAVNVPGIQTDQLKLTGELLADIYLGTITKWNDPRIAALNQGLTLPNLAIAPVHRADGSGTTFVFTDYLSIVNPEWKAKVGSSTSVNWPVGSGAKGSDGVAGTVKQVRGGIGYVESAYATQNKLTMTLQSNKAGSFVAASMKSYVAAAAGLVEGAELRHRPERPAGRGELADRVGDLRAAADQSEGSGAERPGDELLRLGLQPRRRHRHPVALRAAAHDRAGRHPRGVEGAASRREDVTGGLSAIACVRARWV